jgi:hypothetical protein
MKGNLPDPVSFSILFSFAHQQFLIIQHAVVAQSAERRTRNAQVKGSTPFNGSGGFFSRGEPALFCGVIEMGLRRFTLLHMCGKGGNINVGAADDDADAATA